MANFVSASDFDAEFDYTAGDAAEPVVSDALDFVIPQFNADVDADQVEREAADNKFASPPPGTHLFVVDGFLKAPERIEKSGYVNGQHVTYHPYKVAVRLKVAGNPKWTMLDNIELPPSDRREMAIFQAVSTKPDGKTVGFMNRKLVQMLKRLGFACVEGQPIPAEALALRNWVGKQVIANVVVTGKPKCDPGTGLPYEPRPQIELFSYREADATVIASGQVGNAPHGQPTRGRGAAQQPAMAGASVGSGAVGYQSAGEYARAGLNNL